MREKDSELLLVMTNPDHLEKARAVRVEEGLEVLKSALKKENGIPKSSGVNFACF